MQKIKNLLKTDLFILLKGTFLAQIFIALNLYQNSLSYSSESFGYFSIFSSMASLIAVIAALRFDIAISVSKEADEKDNLTVLALISIFFFSILSFGITNCLSHYFADLGKINSGLVAVGVLLVGVNSVVVNYSVNSKNFSRVSFNKVVYGASLLILNIIFGYFLKNTLGMLISFLLAFLISNLLYISIIFRIRNINYFSLRKTFVNNLNYVKFSTIESLFNAASYHLPILLLGYFVGVAKLGAVAFSLFILQIPLVLIGTSVGQNFVANGNKFYNDKLELKKLFAQNLYHLINIGLSLLILVIVFICLTYKIFLGQKWPQLDYFILMNSPWFLIQFLFAPLSLTFYILNEQKKSLYTQIGNLITRLIFLILAVIYFTDYIVEFFSLGGAVSYLIAFCILLKIAGLGVADFYKIVIRAKIFLFSLSVFFIYLIGRFFL